ncbi:peptidyl-prolyl cis-trans isomerase G-like [Papaver somniferum]|uniref:peptidyl-prolyl cis-trans isomerase G-like n=1 Tax=Papaver somniferum TaxID=3469 RepID=UPI000E6FE4AF|nr:peptidyl-prolyl cis-trans isomerase G-like [Papaver somniferum]
MKKNKKETPTTKEKQTPREGGKVNQSRSKKAQGQQAEESVEMKNSHSKLKESREEEEMAQLKEELYQDRRRKEDLARKRIRLERKNEKLIIRNNHLKRKQGESNMQEERYAVGEARTKERHYVKNREGLGRGEQKEREDLKKAIESSRREFREREYRMQQSIEVTQGRNNIPKERRESGLQMVKKCSRNEPCKPEIAALFSLRQEENESL